MKDKKRQMMKIIEIVVFCLIFVAIGHARIDIEKEVDRYLLQIGAPSDTEVIVKNNRFRW